jgi:membrane protease YdiL (CAAX protease family)
MNQTNEVSQYKKLLALIAISTICTFIAKHGAMFAFELIIKVSGWQLSYLDVWIANAIIVYAPSLLIYTFALREYMSFKPKGKASDWNNLLIPAFFAAIYFLSITLSIFSHAVAEIFATIFGTGGLRDPFAAIMPTAGYQWAIMFFFVGFVAPIAEEVVFRQVLLKPLRRFGDWQAIIITGLLFGVFHANFTQFLYAAMGGVFLGIVTVKANSVIPAIIIHTVNNVFDLFVAFLSTTSETAAMLTRMSIVFIGAAAAITLLITKHFHVGRANLPIAYELTRKKQAQTVVLHPAMVVLAAVSLFVLIRGSL